MVAKDGFQRCDKLLYQHGFHKMSQMIQINHMHCRIHILYAVGQVFKLIGFGHTKVHHCYGKMLAILNQNFGINVIHQSFKPCTSHGMQNSGKDIW